MKLKFALMIMLLCVFVGCTTSPDGPKPIPSMDPFQDVPWDVPKQ